MRSIKMTNDPVSTDRAQWSAIDVKARTLYEKMVDPENLGVAFARDVERGEALKRIKNDLLKMAGENIAVAVIALSAITDFASLVDYFRGEEWPLEDWLAFTATRCLVGFDVRHEGNEDQCATVLYTLRYMGYL